MTTVKKIGFFFEMPFQNAIAGLQAIRKDRACPNEEIILSYLKAGANFGVMPGVERDILAHSAQVIGATNIQTDGTWVWPETLAYYVHHYHIALPEEFIMHMRSNAWNVPPNVRLDGLTMPDQVQIG